MPNHPAKKMNVKLLRKIQEHILEEPRRLNMENWGAKDFSVSRADDPPCGTVGCIAGLACWLEGKRPTLVRDFNFRLGRYESHLDYAYAERTGAKLLGLTKADAARLFFVEDVWFDETPHWPARFRNRYKGAKTPRGKAKVTSDRIDHFIKTNGAE